VVPEARLRLAVLRAGAHRHAGRVPAGTAEAVVAAAEVCVAAAADGGMDRGAAADALSVACIELHMLRSTLGAGDGVVDAVRGLWRSFAEVIEVDLFAAEADHSSLSFQLHNYAAFLAGNRTSEDDLRAALHLFTHSVLPGRTRFYNRHRDVRPLARSRYLAADAAGALAVLLDGRGERAEAADWAERGMRWAEQVLADPLYAPGALHPRLDDCLVALRLAPVVLLALEWDLVADRQAVLGRVDGLVALVERWLKETADGRAERSHYHETTTSLRSRLDALTSAG
jgi:hypothetical protein